MRKRDDNIGSWGFAATIAAFIVATWLLFFGVALLAGSAIDAATWLLN